MIRLPFTIIMSSMLIAGFLLSCGGKNGGGGGDGNVTYSTPQQPSTYTEPDPITMGTANTTPYCPSSTTQCGSSDYCCPIGTMCVQNTSNQYGCNADFCCFHCSGGIECGLGCCPSHTICTVNTGSLSSCSGSLCCESGAGTSSKVACPSDVASTCPNTTSCVVNHSARACDGDYACYTSDGNVGCPGEVMCPNGIDFCPSGTSCTTQSGVCLVGSYGGNYCCKAYATPGESCDDLSCQPGSSCVPNAGCEGMDSTATNVCYGPCSPYTDCGNYCCPPDLPVCSGEYSCWCSI